MKVFIAESIDKNNCPCNNFLNFNIPEQNLTAVTKNALLKSEARFLPLDQTDFPLKFAILQLKARLFGAHLAVIGTTRTKGCTLKPTFTFISILIFTGCTLTQPQKKEPGFQQLTIEKPVIQSLSQVDENMKKFKNSLVRLRVTSPEGTAFGTGFFYKTKDLIVTNHHIIGLSRQCVIITHCQIHLGFVKDDKTIQEIPMNVRVEYQNPKKDLAFIRIQNPKLIGNIDPIKHKNTGGQEQLTVVGFFEQNPQITFSKGKIVKDPLKKNPLTLTSIIIGAGFSGSPVLNTKGELVGVVSSYRPLKNDKNVGLAQYIRVAQDSLF